MLTHCTTTKKQSKVHTDVGLWVGKVQMTNKTTGQKKWANVNWASDSSQSRLRVDVSAILDVPVATFLVNSEGAHLWLHMEKKYFHSMESRKLFKHLTKLSIDPKIFYSMLGQPEAPNENWACSTEPALLKCASQKNQTQYSVAFSETDRRLINIDRGSKSLRLRLSRSKVQLEDRFFQALSKSQYKTIEI